MKKYIKPEVVVAEVEVKETLLSCSDLIHDEESY